VTSVSRTLKQFAAHRLGRCFDAKYAEWVDGSEATKEVHRRLAGRAAAVVKAGQILDVGSGPGHLVIELARRLPQTKIVGLDVSPSMIEMAEKNITEAGVRDKVAFRQGDAAMLPFSGSVFDFVVSSWSLHLWGDPARVFAEIHRVLRPGCCALVYDARKHPPAEAVRKWTRTANSLVMRFGLMHSFSEGYTTKDIETIVAGIPFGKVEVREEGADLEIWLEKVVLHGG
jgi:ubiquinone/menaquinone biosynthesis C-methylase UbiE